MERPQKDKRYNAPHLDSMGYMHREVHSHIAIQEMSAVRLSYRFENFHIFYSGLRKHFQYVCYLSDSITKLRYIFQIYNTYKKLICGYIKYLIKWLVVGFMLTTKVLYCVLSGSIAMREVKSSKKVVKNFAGFKIITTFAHQIREIWCPDGGIGRRAGLKHQ